MGRAFEKRKSTIFARADKMSKLFTRVGREIAMAVKSGGPSPDANPALKRVMVNARAANMPKDKIEAAIKKASGQQATDYEIVIYEGYAPHGIAVLVETATDNVTRTVANVRMHFRENGGNFGTSGSVAFLFQKMGVFRLQPYEGDLGELELELIDHGLQEMGEGTGDKGEPQLIIRSAFADFGTLAAAIEAKGLKLVSSGSEYVAPTLVELPEDKAKEVLELIDALEGDDDVQAVYHNLA